MSVIRNIEVSVSEGLTCETLHEHAFETLNVGPNNRDDILWVWLNCPLSGVFRGMDYCPLYEVAGCPLFRGF